MPEFPFLNQQDHPSWSKLTPDRIKPEVTMALDRAEKNLDAIRALQANELTFQNTICALEQASDDLDYAWGLVSHLDSVSNSSDLRKAHNEMLPKVSEFGAKIPLTRSFGLRSLVFPNRACPKFISHRPKAPRRNIGGFPGSRGRFTR